MSSAFVDIEVVELLRDSPDLLAVADAIAATQDRPAAAGRRPVRNLVLAAALVVAASFALIAPWQGRGSGFVAKALAALGTGQVIHVVSVAALPDTEVVDIRTGVATPVQSQTEIWFDPGRGRERVVTTIGGVKVDEVVQTPDGTWSSAGRVWTCAWIAAHPAEATKARVSCNASGVNDPTPHKVPEPSPSLDPALAGFVGGYQDALRSGQATRDGSGTIDGHQVEWLRFTYVDQGAAGTPDSTRVERVAVDTQTHKPIRVETSAAGTTRTVTVAAIETLDPQDVRFEPPALTPITERPVATSLKSKQPVSIPAASTALAGRLQWSGMSVGGLRFAGSTVQQIVTGYGVSSGVPFAHSTGVELLYGGPVTWDVAGTYVRVRESLRPEMLYGFDARRPLPPEGRMLVTSVAVNQGQARAPAVRLWRGTLAKGDLFVAIETTSRSLLLDAARQLEPA